MSRNLAFQLKKIRQQRHLSLDEVSKATGVSKAQLAQIEKGEANPTVSTIWKIAAGMRISFSSLLQPPTAHFMKYSSDDAPHVDEDEGAIEFIRLFLIIRSVAGSFTRSKWSLVH